MRESDFVRQIEQILELEVAGIVTRSSVLTQLPGWSSLKFLGILAFADEELGVTLSPRRITSATTVADLINMLGEKVSAD
ncbi:MAG TPA: acyl carrier protein [Pirellulales bacterium]|nr:acyl carrier protein [Pirellulales bacterium]